ncbi:MAG: hypothetical protein M1837_000791 [Sclerophora amabilis]|nr:MAG: hypothetical protein M1837_000791 [Sclerophora amabilis]
MKILPYHGSTSDFFLVKPGEILKAPMKVWAGASNREALEKENRRSITIERQILERLGKHPKIIPYLGDHPSGILLSEAPHGSLQAYIDSNYATMSAPLRWNLCEQATEAIVHVHSKGVIHSDLRPDNFLVHQVVTPRSASLWLSDFGGSMCPDLELDGGHLPDIPFSDPRMEWQSTPATDIFSLGSIFYVIMTGYWPFMNGPPRWSSAQDKLAYQDQVEVLFRRGEFPAVSGLSGGNVVKGCWDRQYHTAEEVLQAVRSGMGATDV